MRQHLQLSRISGASQKERERDQAHPVKPDIPVSVCRYTIGNNSK